MAFESYYWKKQAKGDIRAILKRLDLNLSGLESGSLDKTYSVVEIKLFTLAYSLRKLLDAKKLPDKVGNVEINVVSFPRNKKVSMPPWSFFDEGYEMNKPNKIKMPLRHACNSFIHSYHFQPIPSFAGKLTWLYFVSDRDRNKCVYRVNIRRLLNLFGKALEQDVTRYQVAFDPKVGDYKITTE